MNRYDVLIIGAGAAGIAAALEAARAGAEVLVVDSAEQPGGTAATSGGGVFIAGSSFQAQHGIHDSPEQAIEDWLAWGGPDVDEEWARRYVESSAGAVFGWLSELGVRWSHLQHHEGNRAPRWHAPAGGGLAVMQALIRAANAEAHIAWQLGTRVAELAMAGGAVTGVHAEGPAGPIELTGRAVVLATGGFNNDLALVRRYAPALVARGRVLLGGGAGARGDGHTMLERVGAQLLNLDALWIYPFATPDYLDPAGERGLVVRGLHGDLWVNAAGHRFHNEDLRGGATGAPALLRQQPPTCWSIIDARIAARYVVSDPRYRRGGETYRDRLETLLAESPFIARGATLAELADATGLDRAALSATVAEHNRRIALGEQHDSFGRALRGLQPLTEPPFFAIQFFPLARKNLGGVRTDLNGQVLAPTGRPISGLFAAGELAGMAGGRINGRAALEGTMLGPSLFSGRVAGRAAAGSTHTTPRSR